jgi:hypothetical protein
MASFSISNVLGDLKTTAIGIVLSVIPIVIQQLSSGTVDWKSIGPSIAIVVLGAFSSFVKKETGALASSLDPSGTTGS